MSASPAGTAGRTPNGNGPLPPGLKPRRPPKKTNPLATSRHVPSKQISKPRPVPLPVGIDKAASGPPRTFVDAPTSPTDQREPTQIIPVRTTKRELLHGLRFHVARLTSKSQVDITDPQQYERPLKLHRKDPRYQSNGTPMDVDSKEELANEAEREKLEAAKAERQRIREEQQKQMAPAATQKRKPQPFKKKVEQVYRADNTPAERKRQQLRYEEALPWHIEDFDEKKVWQGAYEAALSECHVMFMKTEDGKAFRMVPLEKWYKFRQKATVKEHIDFEKYEQAMAKGQRAPTWILKHERQEQALKQEEKASARTGLFTVSGERKGAKGTDSMDFGDQPEVDPDANDIDFNIEEEFADDEENELFEGDDDTKKLAEEKLKRDQLEANVFGMRDEKEVDAEEMKKRELAEVTKRLEKGIKKALVKREKNYDYNSDTDQNPYSEESESEDSEAERAKEEERKREEEQKTKQDQKLKPKDSTKPPSGASSRGANTPSGRKEKQPDHLRVKAAKRPGSPNLSEASGNESSRKRIKIKTGTSTPRPGGLDTVRRDASRQTSFVGAAGSGSDTDANIRNKRLTVNMSNHGSRAGSPGGSKPVSRAASPPPAARTGSATPAASAGQVTPAGPVPTAAEIRPHIPPEGIAVKDLANLFIFNRKNYQAQFIAEVKKVAKRHAARADLLVPR